MKLITPEEVADRLVIQKRTAYQYLAPGGPLHHLRVKVGGTIRVDADAFEQYLTQDAKAHAAT